MRLSILVDVEPSIENRLKVIFGSPVSTSCSPTLHRILSIPLTSSTPLAKMPDKIIFYDLVPSKGSKLFYSPNTMKTRLSLLHKGVPFETRAVTYIDTLGELKQRTGFERVFCTSAQKSVYIRKR